MIILGVALWGGFICLKCIWRPFNKYNILYYFYFYFSLNFVLLLLLGSPNEASSDTTLFFTLLRPWGSANRSWFTAGVLIHQPFHLAVWKASYHAQFTLFAAGLPMGSKWIQELSRGEPSRTQTVREGLPGPWFLLETSFKVTLHLNKCFGFPNSWGPGKTWPKALPGADLCKQPQRRHWKSLGITT